ncbi:hypothetical protein ALT761_02375 [Alteromonas sp. 76-1]|jgi:hypothetical protein|uniref:hypothetical protein n=1 Tax=Alteromonas sp. 76-1 TaxID=2358187 RepID=UPI000FD180B0|nr:hypothetical protein [Alteromonas sp. 76-1]VEL97371.1 hypothetical protein ALT761_02375 [Alteromonas sp. 76-1]
MNKTELVIEKYKLLINYGKSVSTLFLAALGAQVTLLGSVFKEVFEKHQYLSMASLLLMLFAAMTALSMSEASVRRLVGPPQFKFGLLNTLLGGLPTRKNWIYLRSLIAALCFASSMLCFFLLLTKINA